MLDQSVGDIVASRRADLGLSRQELASRVGYSAVMIAKIESGDRVPDPKRVPQLAHELGIDEAQLVEAVAQAARKKAATPKIVDAMKLARQNSERASALRARAERLKHDADAAARELDEKTHEFDRGVVAPVSELLARVTGMPEAVVFPNSVEEVRRVMGLAYGEGVPVVGRGSGTGLSGGAISPPGGIQIAFTRMNRILELDQENRTVTVEPGVINLDLDNYAHKFGLRYAPDPSSQKACSLGGNVAENAGGPHCLAYGVTTNHVLGMETVMEDGSVTWLGGRTREAPGYDLRGVFVGSEGTFGIATRIVLRLLPVPPAVKTFQGVFGDVPSACNASATAGSSAAGSA